MVVGPCSPGRARHRRRLHRDGFGDAGRVDVGRARRRLEIAAHAEAEDGGQSRRAKTLRWVRLEPRPKALVGATQCTAAGAAAPRRRFVKIPVHPNACAADGSCQAAAPSARARSSRAFPAAPAPRRASGQSGGSCGSAGGFGGCVDDDKPKRRGRNPIRRAPKAEGRPLRHCVFSCHDDDRLGCSGESPALALTKGSDFAADASCRG